MVDTLLDYARGGQQPGTTVRLADALSARVVTGVEAHERRIVLTFDDGATLVCQVMPGTLIVRDAEGVMLHAS